MHTRLNKATGLGLAAVGTVALLRGRMPMTALGAVAVLAELSAIEELGIVATADVSDVDRKSILTLGVVGYLVGVVSVLEGAAFSRVRRRSRQR